MKSSSSFLGCAPLVRGGRSRHRNAATRCSSNQRQQLAAAAAVEVPTTVIIMYACWDSSRRGSAACLYGLGLFSRWQPPPKTCQRGVFYSDLCPWSRGCPVLTHIDHSVSARHHTTRILVHSRRLLRVSAAVVCGVNSHFDRFCGDRDWSTSRLSQAHPSAKLPLPCECQVLLLDRPASLSL